MSEELKPCPFCGASASIVQTGAASTPRKPGRLCVITCDNGCFEFNSDELADDQGKAWNTRAELSAIKGGGEAVAWMHSRSGAVATAATKSTMEDGSIPSGYDVPLYTHPPVVAEAEPVDCEWCAGARHDYYGAKCEHCRTAPPASGAVPVIDKIGGHRLSCRAVNEYKLGDCNCGADAVPVPRELLTVACSGGNEAWQALEEIRALLAKGVQS